MAQHGNWWIRYAIQVSGRSVKGPLMAVEESGRVNLSFCGGLRRSNKESSGDDEYMSGFQCCSFARATAPLGIPRLLLDDVACIIAMKGARMGKATSLRWLEGGNLPHRHRRFLVLPYVTACASRLAISVDCKDATSTCTRPSSRKVGRTPAVRRHTSWQ